MPAPRVPRETLAEAIRAHLGVRVRRVRRVTTGLFNETYRVDLRAPFEHPPREHPGEMDHDHLIARIAPPADAGFLFYERDMMAQEPWIHEWILRETRVPVPEILVHDASGAIVDRPFLLMELLQGHALTELSLTPRARGRVLRQVGECLARVHALVHPDGLHGHVGPHRPMTPQHAWPAAFREMWDRLLADLEACGVYSAAEGERLRALFDAHADAFRNTAPRLLHMDVWDQNILADARGHLTGLVDWDRGLCGDPEIEFAVLDYCGISEPAFWEGYHAASVGGHTESPAGVHAPGSTAGSTTGSITGSTTGSAPQGAATSLDPRDAAPRAGTRHLFYYLYELQKYVVISAWRRHDLPRARAYKRRAFQVLGRALGS